MFVLSDPHWLFTQALSALLQNKTLWIVSSSRWSMTSQPKSSASTYSQQSWSNSPVNFSEARVDRRRFAIAVSPSEDGPWRRPFPSADASVSVVRLRHTEPEYIVPLVRKEVQQKGKDVEGKKKRPRDARITKTPTILSAAPRSESRSTRMLDKMFPRRLTRPPQSASPALGPVIIIEMEQPGLPVLPPRVLLSLPSPELNIIDDLKRLGDGNHSANAAVEWKLTPSRSQSIAPQPGPSLPTRTPRHPPTLVAGLRESPVQPQPASDLSTWKPKRPPSPVPPGMRRNSKAKHMRNTLPSHSSPPPPVPALIKYNTSVVPKSPRATFSLPLSPPPPYHFHSLLRPMQSHVVDNEMSLQMILKARASKTATYALHNGGIFSPTLSIE
jgi:hypothetical protein